MNSSKGKNILKPLRNVTEMPRCGLETYIAALIAIGAFATEEPRLLAASILDPASAMVSAPRGEKLVAIRPNKVDSDSYSTIGEVSDRFHREVSKQNLHNTGTSNTMNMRRMVVEVNPYLKTGLTNDCRRDDNNLTG